MMDINFNIEDTFKIPLLEGLLLGIIVTVIIIFSLAFIVDYIIKTNYYLDIKSKKKKERNSFEKQLYIVIEWLNNLDDVSFIKFLFTVYFTCALVIAFNSRLNVIEEANKKINTYYKIETFEAFTKFLDGDTDTYGEGLKKYNGSIKEMVYLNKKEIIKTRVVVNDFMKDKVLTNHEFRIIEDIIRYAYLKKYSDEYMNRRYKDMMKLYKSLAFSKKQSNLIDENKDLRNKINEIKKQIEELKNKK